MSREGSLEAPERRPLEWRTEAFYDKASLYDELERVFDPFYRLEGSRSRETGGTGLGLSIARTILRAHGGDVYLENRPGGGLCAVLVLPEVAKG